MDKNSIDKLRKTYFKIFAMAGMAHVLYTVLFGIMGVKFLMIFNIFSVATYIYISISSLFTNNIYKQIIICIIEVTLFSCVATLLMGNQLGFGYLFVGVLPICYFVLYSTSENRKKSVAIIMIFITAFILISVYAAFAPDHMPELSVGMSRIIYFTNGAAGFWLLIVFFIEFFGVVREDVKVLMVKNEKLRGEAQVDELTGLYNRHVYEHFMNEFYESARTKDMDFCVAMFDIDDFKVVNDTYGHSTGDIVLKAVAETIKNSIRPHDVAIRWGGEEILLLIKGGSNAGRATTERCRRGVEAMRLKSTDGHEVRVTITAGYCTYNYNLTKNEMVEVADRALYRGKKSGKNCVMQGDYMAAQMVLKGEA